MEDEFLIPKSKYEDVIEKYKSCKKEVDFYRKHTHKIRVEIEEVLQQVIYLKEKIYRVYESIFEENENFVGGIVKR